jgi:hypothetical protein
MIARALAALLLFTSLAFAQVAPGPMMSPLPLQQQKPVSGSFLTGAAATNGVTYNSQSFGAAESDRYILVVGIVSSSSTFTGMTIGGVTATNVVSVSSGVLQTIFGIAAVPAGATGTIVLNYTAGSSSSWIYIYRLVGGSNLLHPNNVTGTSSSFSGSLNIPPNSFVVGAGALSDGSPSVTWTGVSADDSIELGGNNRTSSVGSQFYPIGGSATSVGGLFSLPDTSTNWAFAAFH